MLCACRPLAHLFNVALRHPEAEGAPVQDALKHGVHLRSGTPAPKKLPHATLLDAVLRVPAEPAANETSYVVHDDDGDAAVQHSVLSTCAEAVTCSKHVARSQSQDSSAGHAQSSALHQQQRHHPPGATRQKRERAKSCEYGPGMSLYRPTRMSCCLAHPPCERLNSFCRMPRLRASRQSASCQTSLRAATTNDPLRWLALQARQRASPAHLYQGRRASPTSPLQPCSMHIRFGKSSQALLAPRPRREAPWGEHLKKNLMSRLLGRLPTSGESGKESPVLNAGITKSCAQGTTRALAESTSPQARSPGHVNAGPPECPHLGRVVAGPPRVQVHPAPLVHVHVLLRVVVRREGRVAPARTHGAGDPHTPRSMAW